MSDRFREQLIRQVSFLNNSCDLFDNRQWEEAIRIATSIRVIVHDTKKSTSLLKHLNATNINIFTNYIEPPKGENGYISIHGFSMGIINMGKNGQYGYGPNLEDFKPGSSHVLPVDQWWNQVVWVLDMKSRLTRKDIVLSAANQDGGAHVDENLNESYKKLADETWGHINLRKGHIDITIPVVNMHLVAIRTIANELLKSPAFLSLFISPNSRNKENQQKGSSEAVISVGHKPMNGGKSPPQNPFSIKIINEKEKTYRQYIFLNDAEDIVHKIYYPTLLFIKFSKFSKEKKLYNLLIAICHKINMVKYHLLKYEETELKLQQKFTNDVKRKIREGTFLIENHELTAEYEAFLFQVKASLYILVGFLNPLYRKSHKNPLKKQITFENGGLNVIKKLNKYVENHPEEKPYLEKLIEHLSSECPREKRYGDGSINWLLALINNRDIVAHYGKAEWFAFQINNTKSEKSVFPPRFSPEQSILEALKVSYYNLLIFIQDFIALTLGPHLQERLTYCTFREEEISEKSPKWYIQLEGLSPQNVKHNPSLVFQMCDCIKPSFNAEDCVQMYMYYNNFLK